MSPEIPREAEVIRLAREAMNMTAQSAAEASRAHDGRGVSAAYWRDVERGYGGRRGQRVPTRASDRALAAMARVVGVMPAQLSAAGREGAARVLAEILRRENPHPAPQPPPPPPVDGDFDLPPVTPAMEQAMAPFIEEIKVRVRLARRLHPREPLTGSQVFAEATLGPATFPASPRDARTWDFVASQGWPENWVVQGTAYVKARELERAGQGNPERGFSHN